MEHIHRIWEAIVSDDISFFFAAWITGWLMLAVYIVLVKPQWGARFVAITPNSLAMLGVLGTFTGILFGLLDFDVTRIDDSVPELLAGLKIAFTTSIVGITASILFRLVRALVPSGTDASEGVTPEAIHAALVEIRDDGRSSAARSVEQLAELRKAISSEGDSSLLTQMQKLRSTLQDGQGEFINEFRSSAARSAEQLAELRKAISSEEDSSLLTQVQKLRTTLQDGQSEFISEFRSSAARSVEQLGELHKAISSEEDSSLLTQAQKLRTTLQEGQSEFISEFRSSAARSVEQLDELHKAISSEEDSSLLTQLQKLRTTLQDSQSEFIREFREFAKHMIENSQKAIIEALEQVIRDFNQNLTEQFGENFKQLNEAVHSLVEWQDNYRDHVEALVQRLDMASRAVEATQKALESVQEHSERIPEAIKPLEPILNGINTQTEIMGAHLEVLAALRDKAVEAFPIIEANLERITTQFAAGVEDSVEKSRQMLTDGERAHADLRQGYDDLLKDSGEARERFTTELETSLKQMSEQSSQEFARHRDLIEANAKEVQKAINTSWDESTKKMTAQLNEQFQKFDNEMQQALTRSIELLGKNLAAVSEKLVADYTPLTKKLRELVNMMEALKR